VLNIAAVSRECQVSRLDVFTKRGKRAVAVHPKFYFSMPVFFAPIGPSDYSIPPPSSTAPREDLVGQHLRAWCDYSAGRHELHYWQTRAQVEIDFVVYGVSCEEFLLELQPGRFPTYLGGADGEGRICSVVGGRESFDLRRPSFSRIFPKMLMTMTSLV
jgi:hypothetical protein